ncbi:MAG: hypothetical protein LBR61_09900 [Synergistaceae bacterium]|jgi:TPR repeat protein|nr:hypothetical protein [Synergistaceae bacterium]
MTNAEEGKIPAVGDYETGKRFARNEEQYKLQWTKTMGAMFSDAGEKGECPAPEFEALYDCSAPDYGKALACFTRAADEGNAGAMRALGVMFYHGYGTEKNYPETVNGFQKAAEKSDAQAMSELGRLCEYGFAEVKRDYGKAADWYAGAGPAGGYRLGLLYEKGRGVELNYEKARQCYLGAVESDPRALLALGCMYAAGRGIEQSYGEAMKCFHKASLRGNAVAMRKLGVMWEKGLGVAKNQVKASEWYRRAEESGPQSIRLMKPKNSCETVDAVIATFSYFVQKQKQLEEIRRQIDAEIHRYFGMKKDEIEAEKPGEMESPQGESGRPEQDLEQEKKRVGEKLQAPLKEAENRKQRYLRENEQAYARCAEKLAGECSAAMENPDLPRLDSEIRKRFSEMGASEGDWENYDPAASYPGELMFGVMPRPFELPSSLSAALKSRMPFSYRSGKDFLYPYTIKMPPSLRLLIRYDDDTKNSVMTGIQSFLLKLVRFMPMNSCCITFIDPNDRGANLGLLQKLSEVTAWELCKVYASRESIYDRLRYLEGFVDRTSALLAGMESLHDYNETSDTPVEQHVVVINDYPDNFDQRTKEALETLLQNAQRCGISMIFLSQGTSSDLPEAVQGFSRYDEFEMASDVAGQFFAERTTNGVKVGLDLLPPHCEAFIEKVKAAYLEGVKIDNTWACCEKDLWPAALQDSSEGLKIPFALNARKRLEDLELGGALTAHGLLSGATGSGKSQTLHMLIASITMRYHPDDVELWLIDYKKVEFAEYLNNLPPHVRLIGLERSAEFTFSLLDFIRVEFERRSDLFKNSGVSNITEYKKKFGVRSLPRVILVVDEFHVMTQAIREAPQYVEILENILSEYRVFGLSCFFSDQAVSDGLRGLTEKGRIQLRTRIAMNNDAREIRATLDLDSAGYDETLKHKMARMRPGDVIFRKFKEDTRGEIQPVIDRYRTVLISRDERALVARRVKDTVGDFREKDLIVVNGQDRSFFDLRLIEAYESKQRLALDRQIPIHLGTPSNLEPCFWFPLLRNVGNNIMLIGGMEDNSHEMRASLIHHTVRSFRRRAGSKVIFFVDVNDELYRDYGSLFTSLCDENVREITDLREICTVVDELSKTARPGGRRSDAGDLLLVWIGLDGLAEDFSMCPEKKTKSNSGEKRENSQDHLNDIDNLLNEIEGKLAGYDSGLSAPAGGKSDNGKGDEEENTAYDARDDIRDIIFRGPRVQVHTLVTYPSVLLLNRARFINTDHFAHKIGLRMTMAESQEYLGRGAWAAELDKISAACSNGGADIRTFRPYLPPKEESR